MAVITHPESMEDVRAEFERMDGPMLVAQQLCQRGAIDALELLIHHGGGIETARQMLESCRLGLHTIHEVAHTRGIQLISYSEE